MRKMRSVSGDFSGVNISSASLSQNPNNLKVQPEDIKQAIRLLRAVDSTELSNTSNLHVSRSVIGGDTDWRSTSYSEQRSLILDDFIRHEQPRNRSRSVAVGSSCKTARSITPNQHNPRKNSRSRPLVQRESLTTPEFHSGTVGRTLELVRDHFVSINRKIQDIFTADSYSLIELFEILVSLNMSNVSETDIDDFLLFLSIDTYWEDGYFENVTTKKLIEFFS